MSARRPSGPVGALPLALLQDGTIACGDYPEWASTVRAIRTATYDRDILNKLLASIPVDGIEEPLTIGVRHEDSTPFLSDGHHRAVALHELGIRDFPYRWFWAARHHHRPVFEREPLPGLIIEGVRAA